MTPPWNKRIHGGLAVFVSVCAITFLIYAVNNISSSLISYHLQLKNKEQMIAALELRYSGMKENISNTYILLGGDAIQNDSVEKTFMSQVMEIENQLTGLGFLVTKTPIRHDGPYMEITITSKGNAGHMMEAISNMTINNLKVRNFSVRAEPINTVQPGAELSIVFAKYAGTMEAIHD